MGKPTGFKELEDQPPRDNLWEIGYKTSMNSIRNGMTRKLRSKAADA